MFEPLSNEIRAAFALVEVIEQVCKELGVPVAELKAELAYQESAPSHNAAEIRALVCRIINLKNLRQAARKTNMPGSVYLDLQQSIETIGAADTSYRDLRIYSSEEWAQRGNISSQPGLFDESETSPASAKQNVRDDGGNYPLG